jgi:hypothetical protein
MLLGRGVGEAERLRDEVAGVPRIVVDARLLREVERNPDVRAHSAMEELGYIGDMLRQDADGQWFIDYLAAVRSEVDEPAAYLDFLREHRRLVERRLEAAASLNPVSRAFTWLWKYHNSVVDDLTARWRGTKEEFGDLRIPASVSPLLYAFPPSAKAP